MTHQKMVDLYMCFQHISQEIKIGEGEGQIPLIKLGHYTFKSIAPKKFTLQDGEMGIIIPVKSFGGIAKNLIYFQRESLGDKSVISFHGPVDEGEELSIIRNSLEKESNQ